MFSDVVAVARVVMLQISTHSSRHGTLESFSLQSEFFNSDKQICYGGDHNVTILQWSFTFFKIKSEKIPFSVQDKKNKERYESWAENNLPAVSYLHN